MSQHDSPKKRILFVCLGNICRSPSAEAVFRHYVISQGRDAEFEIDSAGLCGGHAGERADARMRAHGARRGYDLSSISRPVEDEDFYRFDYIIGMDEANRDSLLRRAPDLETRGKVSLLTDWHPEPMLDHVPDPYYGGAEGFELVLDLIESCCPHLLRGLDEQA